MLKRFLVRVVPLISATMTGCVPSAAMDPGAGDQTGELTQPIDIPLDFRDSSGTVTVRIKRCEASPVLQHVTTACTVDSDFVLVGGGAEVLGEGDPGALLVASYPDPGLSQWNAQSKDHVARFPHSLRAYSIGLKLAGVSSRTLRDSMKLVSQRSDPDQFIEWAAEMPSSFALIGGGARANWVSQGQLLFGSLPTMANQWIAGSKDHIDAEVGTLDVFAIGITTGEIPGFGKLKVTSQSIRTIPVNSGYDEAKLVVPSGWVLTSIGGGTNFHSDAGRMLTDMIPFFDPALSVPGVTIRSKDHEIRDSGSTVAHIVIARKAD